MWKQKGQHYSINFRFIFIKQGLSIMYTIRNLIYEFNNLIMEIWNKIVIYLYIYIYIYIYIYKYIYIYINDFNVIYINMELILVYSIYNLITWENKVRIRTLCIHMFDSMYTYIL